jgi:ribosome maturation factor RimP
MSGGSRHGEARPERLAGLLEPVVSAAGLELESVRIGRAGRRSLLRVIVDAEHGVSLDDIATVSRAVAAEVDACDAMGPGAYTLEVSSPGVDRPLTEPRHWRRASGRLVRTAVSASAVSAAPRDGTQSSSRTVPPDSVALEGRVVSAGPSGVTLEIDGERREYGYDELGPGQIQVEFNRAAELDGADLDGDALDGDDLGESSGY